MDTVVYVYQNHTQSSEQETNDKYNKGKKRTGEKYFKYRDRKIYT